MSDPQPVNELRRELTRRAFLRGSAGGLGSAALAELLHGDQGTLGAPHFAPRARRIIYLFMSGAPSQVDLWDHKPGLADRFGKDMPPSILRKQRQTTMTSGQERFPVAPSMFRFARHGESGREVSELLPETAKVVDELCVVRSMTTDAINHDPAITFVQTGTELSGRPSLGAWLSYGLGSPNRDLPAYVVLHASWSARRSAQSLYSRLWGTGFLPARHQGVVLRSSGDPVLFLSNPEGLDRGLRRRQLDALAELNGRRADEVGDPEIEARISQYELAFRMQSSVPELADLSGEPDHVLDLYGPDVRKPGTFAASCLLARRLAERDVRCIQIFHRGWDQHFYLPRDLPAQCRDIDRACYGLLTDLRQRGLLDDTLVVWGGEFGRTTYCQGDLTPTDYGRDHHPGCYTVWLAGGGVKAGSVYGRTDDFSFNVVENPVHVHDLNATLLHLMGLDHQRLGYRFQGRDMRLTDVHGHVVYDLLA